MDWGIAPTFVVESAGGVKVIEEGRVSFPVGGSGMLISVQMLGPYTYPRQKSKSAISKLLQK